MIGGGRPLLPEILHQTDRTGAKSPIFDLFFARTDAAVTPSKEVQLRLMSTVHHYALSNEPQMNIVRCP